MQDDVQDLHIILDADILVYQAATAVQQDLETDEGLWVSYGDPDEAWQKFRSMSTMWVRAAADAFGRLAKLTYAFSDLDTSNIFRKNDIHLVDYKANRVGMKRPMVWKGLRERAMEEFDGVWIPRLEGDDVCGIMATDPTLNPGLAKVIVSQDKDMLMLPGLHYVPGKGAREVDEKSGELWFLTQVLMGDRVDGYYGVPNVGPKTAAKILARPGRPWEHVVKAYERAGLTEDHAVANARCAWILQHDDYVDGEIRLWNPERLRSLPA